MNTLVPVLMARLQMLRESEKGATAVEYGIMVALIAVAIITAVTAVGGQLNTLFGQVKTALTKA